MYCSFQKVFWHWWLFYTSQTYASLPAEVSHDEAKIRGRKDSLFPLIFATSFDSHYIFRLTYYITSKYITKKCYDHLRTISKIKGPRGNFSFEGPLLAGYWECFYEVTSIKVTGLSFSEIFKRNFVISCIFCIEAAANWQLQPARRSNKYIKTFSLRAFETWNSWK